MSTTDYAAEARAAASVRAAARRALHDAAEYAGRAEVAYARYRAALTDRDRAELAALRAAGHADDTAAERARVAATGRAVSARSLAACDRAEEEHRRALGAYSAARESVTEARRVAWRAYTEAARRAELAGLDTDADARRAAGLAALAETWAARPAELAAEA